MLRLTALVAALAVTGAPLAATQERTAEREMSTDRPDKTESPYTVPGRRVQIEMDAVNYSRDAVAGVVTHSLEVASINLKYGLTRQADMQLVLVPLHHQAVGAGGGTTFIGFGEITGRLKLNLVGNDSGRVALALMPLISVVRGNSERELEGGLIAPLSVEVGPGWGLGTMVEADLVHLDGLSGLHPVLVQSVTLGRDFGGSVGGYAEIFNQMTPALSSERWQTTLDLGVTWGVTPDLQLDMGANLGVSGTAEDFNPFLGISFRF